MGSEKHQQVVAEINHPINIATDHRRCGHPRFSISEMLELEHLFARAALSRRTQVQCFELLHRRSRCGNNFEFHWLWGGIVVVHAPRSEEKCSSRGSIRKTSAVGPFGRTHFDKPRGNTIHETGESGLHRCLLALAVMEFTEKILPVSFLRTLMALEGKQVFELFYRWFHCG